MHKKAVLLISILSLFVLLASCFPTNLKCPEGMQDCDRDGTCETPASICMSCSTDEECSEFPEKCPGGAKPMCNTGGGGPKHNCHC